MQQFSSWAVSHAVYHRAGGIGNIRHAALIIAIDIMQLPLSGIDPHIDETIFIYSKNNLCYHGLHIIHKYVNICQEFYKEKNLT